MAHHILNSHQVKNFFGEHTTSYSRHDFCQRPCLQAKRSQAPRKICNFEVKLYRYYFYEFKLFHNEVYCELNGMSGYWMTRIGKVGHALYKYFYVTARAKWLERLPRSR